MSGQGSYYTEVSPQNPELKMERLLLVWLRKKNREKVRESNRHAEKWEGVMSNE